MHGMWKVLRLFRVFRVLAGVCVLLLLHLHWSLNARINKASGELDQFISKFKIKIGKQSEVKANKKKLLKFYKILVHTNILRIEQSKKSGWFSFQWVICTINCALYFILFGKRTKKININQKFKWIIDSNER